MVSFVIRRYTLSQQTCCTKKKSVDIVRKHCVYLALFIHQRQFSFSLSGCLQSASRTSLTTHNPPLHATEVEKLPEQAAVMVIDAKAPCHSLPAFQRRLVWSICRSAHFRSQPPTEHKDDLNWLLQQSA